MLASKLVSWDWVELEVASMEDARVLSLLSFAASIDTRVVDTSADWARSELLSAVVKAVAVLWTLLNSEANCAPMEDNATAKRDSDVDTCASTALYPGVSTSYLVNCRRDIRERKG